ncbi:hypothetical protein J6590_032238 [Homalodisca vitripennis]|nr:hypothetical protein J6590_032238 [Homalodisca vitripennis]
MAHYLFFDKVRLSQDNRIKQRRAWLLLGRMTAERSCPCKQPGYPAIGGGSEVTFKPLIPRFVREGFLALKSPGKIRLLYFTLYARGACLCYPHEVRRRPCTLDENCQSHTDFHLVTKALEL